MGRELLSIALIPAGLFLVVCFLLGLSAAVLVRSNGQKILTLLLVASPLLVIVSTFFEGVAYPHFVTTLENEVEVFTRDTRVAFLSFALTFVAFVFGLTIPAFLTRLRKS